MRRWIFVAALALLVSLPLGKAIHSCTGVLLGTGDTTWLVALADVVTAFVALVSSVLVLVLLGEDRERRMPRIPLYDWRITLVRRRAQASAGVDPRATLSRDYEYWTNG